jgi:two-component system sensor histidine kinase CreC
LQDVEAVDGGELVRGLCSDKAAVWQQRGLRLDLQGFTGTTLQAERFLLQQAISNILDNAIDFSPEQGVISIADRIEAGQWRFTVRDRGPGVPDYAGRRVFDRFYSLPRPGSGAKSTGLGLSLVQEVAELHGGTVAIHNHPEGGAELVLSLPLGQD